jgi:hypothetical protein
MKDAAIDQKVRLAIGDLIRSTGAIPSIAETAVALRRDTSEIDAAFGRLAGAHVFIAKRGSNEIHAFDPFCVGPTDFRVRSGGRDWWGICGWDALGIPPALGTAGTLETACPDCRAAISIEVAADGTSRTDVGAFLLVGMPARDFWKDIYLT